MQTTAFVSLEAVTALALTTTNAQRCTPDQQDQIVALWKTAAESTACSPYKTPSGSWSSLPNGTWFSWPCTATSCTATFKDLAAKVPSACADTTAPTTPAPKAAPATTTFSTTKCTQLEMDRTQALYAAAIETPTSFCKNYGANTGFSIIITNALCHSPCGMGFELPYIFKYIPDCFDAFQGQNKKQEIKNLVDLCDGSPQSTTFSTRFDVSPGAGTGNSSANVGRGTWFVAELVAVAVVAWV